MAEPKAGPSKEEEKTNEEQLETGERLVLASDLIKFRGQVDDITIAAFNTNAKAITAKSRLTKADQAWLNDYMEHLPRLYQLLNNQESVVSTKDDFPPQPFVLKTAVPKMKLNELVIKPETFNGTKPHPRKWLDDFEHAAEANRWSPAEMVCYFPTFLEKSAMDWHISVVRPKLGLDPLWEDLRSTFTRHYLGDSDRRALRKLLEQTYQRENERATLFIPRILRILQLVDSKLSEEEKVEVIRDRLRQEYRDKMVLSTLYTIEQLNDSCLRIEAEIPIVKKSSSQGEQSKSDPRKPQPSSNIQGNSKESKPADTKGQNQQERKSGDANKSTGRTCYRCTRKGHISKDCRAKSKPDGSPCNPRPRQNENVQLIQAAPKESEAKPNHEADQKKNPLLNYICSIGMLVKGGESNDLIKQNVRINGTLLSAVIDSGAYCSVIDSRLVAKHQWAVQRRCPALSHAAGGELNCVGTLVANVSLILGRVKRDIKCPVIVVKGLCTEFIMGIDLIRMFKIIIHPSVDRPVSFDKSVTFKGARTIKDEVLPPRSLCFVSAAVTTPATEVIVSSFGFDNRVRVANSVSKVHEGSIMLQVLNMDAAPLKLGCGVQIATIEPIKGVTRHSVSSIVPIANSQETITIGDHLTKDQRQELIRLLNKHEKAFSINGSLGSTDMLAHAIELEPGAKPFKEPVRRHPPLHVAEVSKQVKMMLDQGIIEPSVSPWASEYVVVRKKTGEYRICVDFRRLNAITIKNSFPLPRIDECLDNLNGNCFFTKLDFASGYWQVPMDHKSKPLTAFRTNEGLYQFRVLPFGLSNAPASFQALINLLFSGLKGLQLQVYLDDVCLATRTFAEHLSMLDQVFTVISRANLKLRSSKCEIAMACVNFLGHRISREGVQQDPDKMAALTKLQPPQDTAGVRRALGAFGYYRKFVPSYAAIAQPLNKLLRKDIEFRWTQEEQNAFDHIKEELLKNATLTCPNNEGQILVKTDASLKGIAGIALQQQDGVWKMLACCSRNLNPAESNYSITELEGLAAVYTIQKLRYLLLGRAFTLLVDHCALCILNKTKTPTNSRLHRWALALSEFNFKVKHVKGEAHSDVDCLSRAPVADEQDAFLPLLPVLPTKIIGLARPLDEAGWKAAYEEEPGISELAEKEQEGFYVDQEIVYYKGKLFVPKSKRATIVSEAHESCWTGHDGIEGTIKRLTGHFWWPKLRQDVIDHIAKCNECQLRKSPRNKPPGNMEPHLAFSPMDVLSIDHLGKLPETVSGKRFILVAVDVFSRFIFARACNSQTAEEFKSFVMDIISGYGPPRKIITDNHQSFCAGECMSLFKTFAIDHQLAAGRYHQGNSPVERAIQSLQNKLSLLANQCEDWAATLPFAVLGLNTRICTSTQYSPYELMYGRPVEISTPTIQIDRPYSLFSEALQVGAKDLASALAHSVEAHSKAKRRYERGREATEYNEGDLVLVRVSDRAPKLSAKYEGPFKVLSKVKDIYHLENCNKSKDKRMRHVSQLKPYNAAAQVLFVGLIVSGCLATQHLHETSPIFWVEDQDRFVSEGMLDFPYLLVFKSPCHYIKEYAVLLDSHANANPKVKNEIGTNLGIQMVRPSGQPVPRQPPPPQTQQQQQVPLQPQQVPLQPQQVQQQARQQPQAYPPVQPPPNFNPAILAPPMATPPYDDDAVEELSREPAGQWLSKEEAEAKGFRRPTREAQIVVTSQAYVDRCNELANGIKRRMARATHPIVERPRNKRQAAFILGMIASDTISWIRQKFTGDNTASTEQLKQTINLTTRKMSEKTSILAVANKVLASNQKRLASQISALSETLAELPSLEMFAEHVLSGLENYEQLLDRLIISVVENKLDTITLEQVFGVNQLENVEARDLSVQALEPMSQGALKFYFHGHVRSRSTKIYQVHSFSYYANLTATPMRNDYVGKPTLIKNATSNCVRAIDTSSSTAITEECSTQDYLDPTLKLWRRTPAPDVWKETRHSTHMVAWPHILIYCWGNNIGLGAERTDWTPCPTYVFKMNYTDTFRTSDNLVVHVAKSKSTIKEFNLNVVLDVHNVHFSDYEPAHQIINHNLALVQNLTDEAQKNVVIEIGETKITFQHATYTLLSLITTVGGIYIIVRTIKKCKILVPQRKPSHLRKTVEKQVNLAINDTKREVQIAMQEQVQSEVNRQLNSQLNRMVLDSRQQIARFNNRRRAPSITTIDEVNE